MEVVVIAQLTLWLPCCKRSDALCAIVNSIQSGPTKHITMRLIHSNVNVRESLVGTCDVVVGLVLCKSSGGTRVDFLG